MKAHPSIAFNTFSGTSGEVTARDTKNGTVLSSRAKQPKLSTPAQKTERAILAKIVRHWKALTASQIQAWNEFAENFRSNSATSTKAASTSAASKDTTTGADSTTTTIVSSGSASTNSGNNEAYRLSGFHVYVRHNCSRLLLGLDLLQDPPSTLISVPQVSFSSLCVTPDLIQFDGIQSPGTNFRLAVGMSRATSAGVSYGVGRCVLIDPAFSPDEGVADLTNIYADRLGIDPVIGQKYFVTVYWIERLTGFTGPRTTISRVCIATPPNN